MDEDMMEKKVVIPKKIKPAVKKPVAKKAFAAKPAPAAKPTVTKEEVKELAKGVKPLSPLGSL